MSFCIKHNIQFPIAIFLRAKMVIICILQRANNNYLKCKRLKRLVGYRLQH